MVTAFAPKFPATPWLARHVAAIEASLDSPAKPGDRHARQTKLYRRPGIGRFCRACAQRLRDHPARIDPGRARRLRSAGARPGRNARSAARLFLPDHLQAWRPDGRRPFRPRPGRRDGRVPARRPADGAGPQSRAGRPERQGRPVPPIGAGGSRGLRPRRGRPAAAGRHHHHRLRLPLRAGGKPVSEPRRDASQLRGRDDSMGQLADLRGGCQQGRHRRPQARPRMGVRGAGRAGAGLPRRSR